MDFSELGLSLAVLVHHLFQKYLHNPRKAFCEVTLRTRSTCTVQDLQLVQSIHELRKTNWFQEMATRYNAMLDFVRDKNKAIIEEMQGVINNLYPHGCTTSEFANAVETCTALIPYTIHTEQVLNFLDEQSDALHLDGIFELSTQDLTLRIVNDLLVKSMISPRWWREDHTDCREAAETVKVTKVALRLSPIEIVIQYSRPPWSVRSRKIHLESVFSLEGPTTQIARRLARSHDSLLDEKEFQRLLTKLQHLCTQVERVQGKSEGVMPGVTDAFDALESVPPVIQTKIEPLDALVEDTTMNRKAKKADIGLLYRDPSEALHNVDLNDADELTTNEFKEFMNKEFQKVAIKPGDPDYMYDKRVDVNPTKESTWDDSESD